MKEKLKKCSEMGCYEVSFSYIDNDTFEKLLSVLGQLDSQLRYKDFGNHGQVYIVLWNKVSVKSATEHNARLLHNKSTESCRPKM